MNRPGVGPRVVSLVPSSTETLLALGVDVVACTRFCEQPEIAHVGGTKNPDVEAIVRLAPDLVVMDREENRSADATGLAEAGLDLFVSDVRTVADAARVVVDLAARVGRPVPSFDRFEPDAGIAADASAGARVSAFVPIWRRPWMSINSATYGSSLLAHLGVDVVTADFVDAYPVVELEAIRELGPGVVIVPSEPYEFGDRHLDELVHGLSGDGPPVRTIRIDGQDLFWWGIRTPGAIRRLRDRLHGAGGRLQI